MLFAIPSAIGVRGTSLVNTVRNLGLTSGLTVCLDAGDANSYPGSGQNWKDLSGNGNDFYLGATSSAGSDDPTFSGTAGRESSAEYFSTDGGDFFQYVTMESVVKRLHKDNQAWAVCGWVNPAAFTTSTPLFCTSQNSATPGISVFIDTSKLITVAVNNGVSGTPFFSNHVTGSDFTAGAWSFFGVSVVITGGAAKRNVLANAYAQNATSITVAGSPSASDAAGPCRINATETGVTIGPSGNKFNSIALWSSEITLTQFQSIYDATRGKFGV